MSVTSTNCAPSIKSAEMKKSADKLNKHGKILEVSTVNPTNSKISLQLPVFNGLSTIFLLDVVRFSQNLFWGRF